MSLKNKFNIWQIGGDDIHLRIPLLKTLQKRGFKVGAIGSKYHEAFKEHGIEFYTYPLQQAFNPFADLKSLFKLIRLLNNKNVCLIHAFDTKPGIFVPLAAYFAKIPVIIKTVAGMGYVFSSNDIQARLLRPLYRFLQVIVNKISDMIIFQNKDDYQYFLTHRMVSEDKCQVILSSGIDLNDFDVQQVDSQRLNVIRNELNIENRIVIILVSRLLKNKGVLEYLEAARLIRKTYPKTAFLLVGPIDSEGNQAISKSHIEQYSNDVIYLGERNNICELLSLSDIFALPTYYREGVPRVLLEAGAIGLPIITSDMPGCREVVRNDWNGFLIQPQNVKAIVEKIEILINDKSKRYLMGQRSKSYVRENFNLELVADSYAALYNKLLNQMQN